MGELKRFIRKLDLFRRIDESYLTSATAHGATFTLVAYFMMGILAVCEFWNYLSPLTSSEVMLDQNQDTSLLIKFNITMLALPCKFLAVDVYDKYGWKRQSADYDVQMIRMHSSKGNLITSPAISSNSAKNHEFHANEMGTSEIELDEEGHHALDLKGYDGFHRELVEHDYTLMNFYAPWCHWCKALAPTYEAAAVAFDDLKLKPRAKFASLNCEKYNDICVKYKVHAYPTLLIFNLDSPIYPVYHGERTVDSLVNFLRVAIENNKKSLDDTQFDYACRIIGHLNVPRVPGNFHIEARSEDHDMSPQMSNVSHIVHSLQFGENLEYHLERKLPAKHQQMMHPLNGAQFLLHELHQAPQHYISVVNALYKFWDGRLVTSYFFTSQNRVANYGIDKIPEAKFSYEMSPVKVVISQCREPLYRFITALLAIIGGTFSMISLVNTAIGTVGTTIKRSLGKAD